MNKIIFSLFTALVVSHDSTAQEYDMAPLAGAKMYFSDKPFTNGHENGKTSFHSSDAIYGRIELSGQALQEAFKFPKDGGPTLRNKNDYFLNYALGLYKNGERVAYWGNYHNYIYVFENQKGQTFLNFDIAPGAANPSSRISQDNDFESYFFPFYSHLIQEKNFPDNGEYTVMVLLYNKSMNAWGKDEDPTKWPLVVGEFKLQFDTKDIGDMKSRGEEAKNKMNTVQLDKLPDYFTNLVKVTDPAVTVAKVTPMIKKYLVNYEILKIAMEPSSSMWTVVKNDLGILSYRYVTGYYRIVYKKDGKCSLGSIRVLQDYVGGGKYGNLYCKFWGDEAAIECSKVK
jgi:hypothetical protein